MGDWVNAQLPAILQSLPTLSRLALSYAPRRAYLPTLALLGLDARLASIVRQASEPMLAQLRLAWWRDLLGRDCSAWPAGEPLLGVLASWPQEGLPALVALVDGWEGLADDGVLPAQALLTLAEARARAWRTLAAHIAPADDGEAVFATARQWALTDLKAGLSRPEERAMLADALALAEGRKVRLSRGLRPLVVLREMAGHAGARGGAGLLLRTLRLGLLGR